jgi:hypothetical protein
MADVIYRNVAESMTERDFRTLGFMQASWLAMAALGLRIAEDT